MKAVFALLALALVAPSRAASTCRVALGSKLSPINGKGAVIELPCKYGAVRQQCGDWFVRASPGNVYINRHFINTIWLGVIDKSGNEWEGRTASKIAAKYINDAGNTREAFEKKGGNLETDDVFDFSKTDSTITATAKDGSFSVTFGPFDPAGSKHRNVEFEFVCNRDDIPPAFPQQICGGTDKKEVQNKAEEWGFKPVNAQKFKPAQRDKAYYYAIFTDAGTDQSPSEKCGEVVDTMVNVCPSDALRQEAINNCYLILYSTGHRQCATKYSCELIDVFAACVKFVCSNYTDKEACNEVGEAIDMCRTFPGLSEKVSKCYNDLFIVLDPNSVYYKK